MLTIKRPTLPTTGAPLMTDCNWLSDVIYAAGLVFGFVFWLFWKWGNPFRRKNKRAARQQRDDGEKDDWNALDDTH